MVQKAGGWGRLRRPLVSNESDEDGLIGVPAGELPGKLPCGLAAVDLPLLGAAGTPGPPPGRPPGTTRGEPGVPLSPPHGPPGRPGPPPGPPPPRPHPPPPPPPLPPWTPVPEPNAKPATLSNP